jgi:peptide-methionine (R)-S-oxide reductase
MNFSRRKILTMTTAIAGLNVAANASKADVVAGRDPFDYEITKTEAEWREQLSDHEYTILREGDTEKPKSSPLWNETADGSYHCKGCDLPHYSSAAKMVLDKGWLFFTVSEPNAQLMSQDSRAEMAEDADPFESTIEVHCRRCGSHVGHILPVIGRALHCVNGASLTFHATTA